MPSVDVGVPNISGDDATCRLFVNNAQFGEDMIVSATVKPNTTKYRDAHMGNRVLKVDIRYWGWDLDLKFFYKTDKFLQAVVQYAAAKSTAGSVVPTLAIMLAIQQRDNAALKPGYLFSPVVFDYDLDIPGMTERIKQGASCWAESCSPFVK